MIRVNYNGVNGEHKHDNNDFYNLDKCERNKIIVLNLRPWKYIKDRYILDTLLRL